MKSTSFRIGLGILILTVMSAAVFAQGRGRGRGQEKRQNIFNNLHDARDGRFDGRGRSQDWKCGVFVNCHDARDGRVDRRGPNRLNGRNVFNSRGSRVSYRNRYNINDYWRRRHVTDMNNRWRYRNRSGRDR
jgi:hypothetical protein